MLNAPVFKRLGWIAFWLLITHLAIEFTGHHYLYDTLKFTVLRGKLGPGIQEFQEMPNRPIDVGIPESWPEARRYNDLALEQAETDYHDKTQSVSFLVIHRDSLVFEQYWDGFSDTSRSNSFSMAKSVVSALTGIAIDKGHLKSVDDPVYYYLPQYETELGKKLTIKDLLTMSAGVNFSENYLNPFAFPARANYGDDLELLLTHYEVVREPGEVFDYQSGATQILAFVLMAATRSSLSDYASQHLWQRVGAQHPALWSLDREGGVERAFCCINATARDFARIGKLYLHHGMWNGERILDSSFVAHSVQAPGTVNSDGTPCEIYGYSWWLGKDEGRDFYMMRGIKGQYVIVVPELDLIVVRMGRKRDNGTYEREHPDDVYHYLAMGKRLIESK
jgi:CubicO group peptidase (beta-lactamase class C family)